MPGTVLYVSDGSFHLVYMARKVALCPAQQALNILGVQCKGFRAAAACCSMLSALHLHCCNPEQCHITLLAFAALKIQATEQ